ncbi:MAG: zinc ribbon domain-containing protein [Clostridia bacterium]|nr:zinc ribbon domain-containing protein [Clostridia bacterium]
MNELKNCPSCGNPIGAADIFCENCGYDTRPAREAAAAASAQPVATQPPAQSAPQYAQPQPQYAQPQQQYAQPQPTVIYNPPQQTPITAQTLPAEFRPLNPWAYIGYSLLFAIPIVGFILMFVFAFGGGNINKKNFAKSYVIIFFILLALVLIFLVIMLVAVNNWRAYIR